MVGINYFKLDEENSFFGYRLPALLAPILFKDCSYSAFSLFAASNRFCSSWFLRRARAITSSCELPSFELFFFQRIKNKNFKNLFCVKRNNILCQKKCCVKKKSKWIIDLKNYLLSSFFDPALESCNFESTYEEPRKIPLPSMGLDLFADQPVLISKNNLIINYLNVYKY